MPSNTKSNRCCSVLYCQKYKGKRLSLHSLPKDLNERIQWIRILSIKTEIMPKPILVCIRHFKTTDFITSGKKISLYDVK